MWGRYETSVVYVFVLTAALHLSSFGSTMKYKLNPDTKVVEQVRQGLKATGGYCPCMVEKTPDTKCPCKTMRETGECHCGLYVR